jgi:hypothetical protein
MLKQEKRDQKVQTHFIELLIVILVQEVLSPMFPQCQNTYFFLQIAL